MTIKQLPSEATLIQNSQDITATLEHIGQSTEDNQFGCLFVIINDGEYEKVWGCKSNIPHLSNPVHELLFKS